MTKYLIFVQGPDRYCTFEFWDKNNRDRVAKAIKEMGQVVVTEDVEEKR